MSAPAETLHVVSARPHRDHADHRAHAAHRTGAVVAAALLFLSACGPQGAAGGETETLTVFAASSLTDAFGEIGSLMEDRHPGVDVELNFLGSSDLAAQIEQGAPAHVFASADRANMRKVAAAGLVPGDPEVFALNRLAIAVRAGNPHGIGGLEDLEDPDLVVSLCDEEVPAGAYARQALARARVDVEADSLETEVRSVITRVATGEADTGIVYVTDVVSAGDRIEAVPIPREDNVVASYPIAALEDAPAAAEDFVALVLSERGRRILEDHGFSAP